MNQRETLEQVAIIIDRWRHAAPNGYEDAYALEQIHKTLNVPCAHNEAEYMRSRYHNALQDQKTHGGFLMLSPRDFVR